MDINNGQVRAKLSAELSDMLARYDISAVSFVGYINGTDAFLVNITESDSDSVLNDIVLKNGKGILDVITYNAPKPSIKDKLISLYNYLFRTRS